MNGELIAGYIKENWIWMVASLLVATSVITLLIDGGKKRKWVKNSTGGSQITVIKGRRLAVCSDAGLTISGYASSIIGTRKDQQDSYAVIPINDEKKDESGLLGIVCDGMGGLEFGKKASKTGVVTFIEQFQKNRFSAKNYTACARMAIDKADENVVELSKKLGDGHRSGTTLVSVYVTDGKLHWCSVGDSRIYHYRQGKIDQLTRDHNYLLLLMEQVRKGMMSKEKAETDPEKDSLISFIGIDGVPLADIEEQGIPLKSGDIVVLCSDGLYKALSVAEMENIICSYEEKPAYLPGILTASAMDKWCKHQDNTTVVVLSCR